MKRLIIILFLMVSLIMLISIVSADTIVLPVVYDRNLLNNPSDAATSWTTLRNAASATSNGAATTVVEVGRTPTTTTSGGFDFHYRAISTFNGSDIPDDAIFDSATLTEYGYSSVVTLAVVNLSVIDASPTNPTTAANGDYSKTTFTRMASDIPHTSYNTTGGNGTNTFTLNSDGLSKINKTGLFTFMFTHNYDVDNLSFTWATGTSAQHSVRSLAYAGGTQKMFITLIYHTGSAPVSSFTVNRPITRIPQVLTFTNTSTNTPTSWNYSWGDGTWTNGTTQNPTHQYKKRGIFPVFLLSSNAQGNNTSATQNIRVVGYENSWY
jgi:PKD repeat protein